MGASIIDSKMFRVRYFCNNVTTTTEDSSPTDIETVHIAYAFFFYQQSVLLYQVLFLSTVTRM